MQASLTSTHRLDRFATAWLIAVGFVCSAHAQWLELDSHPEPPLLRQDSYAALLVAQLDEEMNRGPSHDDAANPFTTASVNVRRLARALLLSDVADARHASVLIVEGMKLHGGRATTDASLERIARAYGRAGSREHDRARAAMNMIREFNTLVQSHLSPDRVGDLAEHDIAAVLAPLDEAVALFENETVRSTKPDFDQLRARALAHDPQWTHIEDIAAFLERGWTFAELRPRIVHWYELLHKSLDWFAAIADASWLAFDQRTLATNRARKAFEMFRQPEHRTYGEHLLQQLIAQTCALTSITQLAQSKRYPIDLTLLRNAYLTLTIQAEFANDADRAIERMNWLAELVERMNRFRAIAPEPSRTRRPLDEMHRVHSQIVETYLATEQTILEHVNTLAHDPAAARAEPAIAAIFAEHRRLVDDLARLARMEQWINTMVLVDHASASDFAARMKQLALTLSDPLRRIDTAFMLDRIEADITRYWPMPFEPELRRQSPIAHRLTGQHHRELLDILDELRVRWAQQLAEGHDASDAAHQLYLLHRLLHAMEDIAGLIHADPTTDTVLPRSVTAMNALPYVYVSQELVLDTLQRAQPLLRRASRAAVENRWPRLLSELDTIERDGALAALLGRLCSHGDVGLPAKHCDFSQLAMISRYAAEALYMQVAGQPHEATQLRLYVNRLARTLLQELRKRDGTHPD